MTIIVEGTVHAPMDVVWGCWTKPEHIVQWAFASDTWEASRAENDVRVGGRFSTTMAAKDKSASFDFGGMYTEVVEHARIAYDIDDGRHVDIEFREVPDGVHITETFEAETENTPEMQRSGWQAILQNFAIHVETEHGNPHMP